MTATLTPTAYTLRCGSENISQDGLTPILVRLGYYKCLDCGKTGKPLRPDASAASEPVTQPA